MKFYCHKQYIWTSVGSDRWSPGSDSWRYKDMCLSFFLVPNRELKKSFDDEIEGPELTIMSMARELYVYPIFLGLGEFFWLVVEEYEGFSLIRVLE